MLTAVDLHAGEVASCGRRRRPAEARARRGQIPPKIRISR
jgi:hypothetical protein